MAQWASVYLWGALLLLGLCPGMLFRRELDPTPFLPDCSVLHVACLLCTTALATTCFTCDVMQNLPNKKGIKEPNPSPGRLSACAKFIGIYLRKT